MENRMKNAYHKEISTKEYTRLKKKIEEHGMNFDETFSVIGTSLWLLMIFTLILLPLSISTWILESITRYPDQRRSLKKDFEDLEIYKNYNAIVNMLENYVKVFKTMV